MATTTTTTRTKIRKVSVPKGARRRPVGRPRSEEGSKQFWLRLGKEERDAFTAAADTKGIRLGTWMKLTCRKALGM